tara:strand:- start:529 stop:1392 length:864 start_codon:yes stop_codon:yes gene_type:complete
MNIGIIGLGLMGGSFAKDVKKIDKHSIIYGSDKSDQHLKLSFELNLIDFKLDDSNLSKIDLLLISIPVDETIRILPEILDKVGDKTLVVDVGSTKSKICRSITSHKNRKQFLAMHPISGTENSGPTASVSGLYFGITNILCEADKTDTKLLNNLLELLSNFNMKIIYMDPMSHDEHISYVSHLSHVTSFILAKTVIEKEKIEKNIFDLAGSGFESTVRLAKSSPFMWTPIFLQNKSNLVEALEEYINNLNDLKVKIQNDDKESIINDLNNINRVKKILGGIKNKNEK